MEEGKKEMEGEASQRTLALLHAVGARAGAGGVGPPTRAAAPAPTHHHRRALLGGPISDVVQVHAVAKG